MHLLVESKLIKTDANLNMIWSKTIGRSNYNDRGHVVGQTSDGGYYIITGTRDTGDGKDVLLVRTDVDGNMLWSKTFGGCCDGWSGDYDDRGHSVQQTADGGYIIVGATSSFGAVDSDLYLI